MPSRTLLPLSGVAAVLLLVVAVVIGGGTPAPDASAASSASPERASPMSRSQFEEES